MPDQDLAARYPLRPMKDAPRVGTPIVIFSPVRKPFLVRHESELGWHNHSGTFPWVDHTALGWLPVPAYDYEARIAELQAEVERLRDAERVAWLQFEAPSVSNIYMEEWETSEGWFHAIFRDDHLPYTKPKPSKPLCFIGEYDRLPLLTPAARAIIDEARGEA